MLLNQFGRRCQLNFCRQLCAASPTVSVQRIIESSHNDENHFNRIQLLGRSFLKLSATMHLMTIENASSVALNDMRNEQLSQLALPFKRKPEAEPSDKFDSPRFPSGDTLPMADEEALIRWKYKPKQEIQKFCGNEEMAIGPQMILRHQNALIGSYLVSYGEATALKLIDWLDIPVLHPFNAELNIKSPMSDHSPEAKHKLSSLLHGYNHFEKILQYTFRDRSYLLQAVSHCSFKKNDLTAPYNNLAFLGDAVLDYILTHRIYYDQRNFSADTMLEILKYLTCNSAFASNAVRHQFHKYLRHVSISFLNRITTYAVNKAKKHHPTLKEMYLNDDDLSSTTLTSHYLADSFEAVAGAIFMDSAMTLPAVSKVYLRLMEEDIDEFTELQPKPPVKELMDHHPDAIFSDPIVIDEPSKACQQGMFQVIVNVPNNGEYTGRNMSVPGARRRAARNALESLRSKATGNSKTIIKRNI